MPRVFIVLFDQRAGWAVGEWWSQSRNPEGTFEADATPTFHVVGNWTHNREAIEQMADRLNARLEKAAAR
jgi:hypothetical protein